MTERHNTKLEEWIVRLIRRSRQSNVELAKLIGVSTQAIRDVRAHRSWADVKGE